VFASSPLASVSLGSTTAAPLCVCVVAARLGFAGFNHRRAARRSTTAAPLCVCIVAARLGSRFLGWLFHPRTATLVFESLFLVR
jgi:hypothetical protein